MLLLISQARILVQNPLYTSDLSRIINIPTYIPCHGFIPAKLNLLDEKHGQTACTFTFDRFGFVEVETFHC